MIKKSNHHKRNYYGQCAGPRLVINYGQNTFLNCLEIFCKQTNLLNESYKKRKKKVIEIMSHIFPIGISIELHKEIMIKLKLTCLCITRSKLA